MRVLLVGLGRWGEKHLRVLSELGAEIWAADLSEQRCALAVRSGIAPDRVVADYRLALRHVEAVDVVTPADSHLAIADACVRAGKACFVEKPLTATVADGRALATIVRESRGVLQVGHIFRFHPVTAVLRERLASAELGPIRYAAGRFSGFKRPRTDVGVTMTDAIHYFDLFTELLGQPPTTVTAVLRDHLGRGMDDWSLTTLECGAVSAVVEAGYFSPTTHRDCLFIGERASIAADFGTSVLHISSNRHVAGPGGWEAREGPVETVKVSGPEPLRAELEQFLRAAAHEAPPAVDVGAGLLAIRIVEAARRSSALGRRVSLDEID